ncbi:MFS transporter [Streptomyces sp. TR06-5]|uniref:MFS transporter n=1 Tax=unclassified Streptomyces TaxID=2593676 RepID=UPI0039A2AAB9
MASVIERETSDEPRISRRRALVALGGGNAVEWYDWMVYGLLAAYIGPQFFPSGDAVADTMSALAVFAVGFAARPLGAVVFGTLADRIGRRLVMLLSVGTMVFSTAVIAVLPTHASLGIWAGAVLLLCRILQGLSTGIEAPLNSAYIVEMAPEGQTARFGGIVSVYVQAGIIGASLVCFLTSAAVGAEAMAAWGWRIPFVIGVVVGLFFLWLRRSLPETLNQEENRFSSKGSTVTAPGNASVTAPPAPQPSIQDVWRGVLRHRFPLLTIVFVVAGAQALNYTWAVGLPSLARSAYGENPTHVFAVSTLAGLVVGVLYPVVGRIADRNRISRTFVFSRLAVVPMVFLVLAYQGSGITTFAAVMLIGAPLLAFNMGLYNTVSATLMPMTCRVTGVGLGYAVGVAGFGGTAPYVLLWLQEADAVWAFPAYVAVLGLTSVLLYVLAFRRGCVRVGN